MFFYFINCLKFKQPFPAEKKKVATVTVAGLVSLFCSETTVLGGVETELKHHVHCHAYICYQEQCL